MKTNKIKELGFTAEMLEDGTMKCNPDEFYKWMKEEEKRIKKQATADLIIKIEYMFGRRIKEQLEQELKQMLVEKWLLKINALIYITNLTIGF